ncbi:class I SAM-dependent methyltransferase [Patulibacter sp. SYSU D01012]|uniref:class I SAM-dependent methyltransferase n=1 Tax=Patulibacter sp. SYSU D01012 TaxID=2817381 RepID=UPI001B30250E|nr:class I SAM-dependent methyltransferase [Patulibacter sp. SYSU D01012]
MTAAETVREKRRLGYETPRPDVQRYVPTDARRILDIGCASGALGAALKDRQPAEVVGIELMPEYARDAAQVLDRVVCADAAEGLATPDLGEFDCVIAADVLEHLVDPWSVLNAATARLRPGGTVIVSLPNVQYLRTFRELARGWWPREDVGPYDRTHLQWFTIRDARQLVEGAGAEVVDVTWLYAFSGTARRIAMGLGERWAPFLTSQFVVAGRKRP